MKNKRKTNVFCVILTTTPSKKEAVKLVRLLLEKKWIACGSMVPTVESHYWWRGKIESAAENLVILKTTLRRSKEVIRVIRQNHSYEVPEVIVLPFSRGNRAYLNWLLNSVR